VANFSTRHLQHKQANRTLVKPGVPQHSEGVDGDLTLRITKSGLKLYAKFNNKWYVIGMGSLKESAGRDTDDVITNHTTDRETTLQSRSGKLDLKNNIIANKNYINKDGKQNKGIRCDDDAIAIKAQDLELDSAKKIMLDAKTGQTYISLDAAKGLLFKATTDMTFNAGDGNFAWEYNGDEFSESGAGYAGMILGSRYITDTLGAYTLTTSYANVGAGHKVAFIVPPSGNVKIHVQIFFDSISSSRILHLALSDEEPFNSLGAGYEQTAYKADESDDVVINHNWIITGLTPGYPLVYYLGAKISATSGTLRWGGTTTGRYCDFIMEAIALP
jgi:hypothetical protein